MRKKRNDPDKILKSMYRSNPHGILNCVLAYQFIGMMVVAFKELPPNPIPFVLAILLPLITHFAIMIYSYLWQVDRTLMILVLFLCSVGLVTLQDIGENTDTSLTQPIFFMLGLLSMGLGIVMIRKLTNWERFMWPTMIVSALLLSLPYLIGTTSKGAKNWLNLRMGSFLFSLQPSEFVKLSLIFCLSACFSGNHSIGKRLLMLASSGALCALLLLEHDLGALLLFFLVTCAIYYAATSHGILTCIGLGIGVAGSIGAYRLFPYVRSRVAIFLDPWSDPLDKGYQIIQSLLALSSGGWFGLGLGLGYPRIIPEYRSDFIFSAICEEYGLIFAMLLLVVYLLVICRGAYIAVNCRRSFHMLMSLGISMLIGLQVLIITGGNVKLIPLTGITLPFISDGGSSMISMMGGVGILLGISSINAYDEHQDHKHASMLSLQEMQRDHLL